MCAHIALDSCKQVRAAKNKGYELHAVRAPGIDRGRRYSRWDQVWLQLQLSCSRSMKPHPLVNGFRCLHGNGVSRASTAVAATPAGSRYVPVCRRLVSVSGGWGLSL